MPLKRVDLVMMFMMRPLTRLSAWTRREGFSGIGLSVAVAAVVAVAVSVRLPDLNPPSLWVDDLIYGALIKSDLWSMLTVPIHVAPGLFVILRLLYAALPDPEWSLQFFPFACGIAAIPVMAVLVRVVTRDDSLAAVAAAVTALNPLLANYSLFVRQYTVDFLVTAIFLLVAARLLGGTGAINTRQFARVALCGGLFPFLSVTSVFASAPIVAVGAASACWRRLGDRHGTDSMWTIKMLANTAVYGVAVLAAWLLLRNRSNRLIRGYWADGFMPIDPAGAWDFLTTNGRSLLEKSLPVWETAERAMPLVTGVDPDGRGMEIASWPLPLLGIGLVWLLWRRSTRRFGWVLVGFYAACLAASAGHIYPFGAAGRTDIFAFPAAICLFAVGIQAVTERLRGAKRVLRLGAAGIVMALALWRPVHVAYFTLEHDAQVVDFLSAHALPDDAIILSQGAGFLAAFYGRWPVSVTPTDQLTYGVQATIIRDHTLQLPWMWSQDRLVERPKDQLIAQLLERVHPTRVWCLFFPGSVDQAVLDTLERRGFVVQAAQATRQSALYLAVSNAGTAQRPMALTRGRVVN